MTVQSLFRNPFFSYGLIILTGFILYSATLSFGLSALDDETLISRSFYLSKNAANFSLIFARDIFYPLQDGPLFYRPILEMSYMINAYFGPTAPFPYHAGNIIIHLITACLLFSLLIQMGHRRSVALFGTLLFTVHPLLAQTIAWIPGRNDSLLALFLILSFKSLINFSVSGKRPYYLLHNLFFAFAIFTKESAVVFPLISFLYLRMLAHSKASRHEMKKLLIGWLCVIALWGICWHHAIKGAMEPLKFDIGTGIISAFVVFIYGIGKALFPFGLSIALTIKDMPLYSGYVALLLILITILCSHNARKQFVIFGIVWFILFLVPAVVHMGMYNTIFIFMPHRMYVPMIGLCIAMLEIDVFSTVYDHVKTVRIIGLCIILIFAGMAYAHVYNFENKYTFWENVVRSSPNSSSAHRILGDVYYENKNTEKAAKEYKTALALNPQEPMIHARLGALYARQREWQKAELEYRKDIALTPCPDFSYVNLGVLYYKQGKTMTAQKLWRKALAVNPGNGYARTYLKESAANVR